MVDYVLLLSVEDTEPNDDFLNPGDRFDTRLVMRVRGPDGNVINTGMAMDFAWWTSGGSLTARQMGLGIDRGGTYVIELVDLAADQLLASMPLEVRLP